MKTLNCGSKKRIFVGMILLLNLWSGISAAWPITSDESYQILEGLRQDKNNTSFTTMMKHKVMEAYRLTKHKIQGPYFYTDDRDIIAEVISRAIDRPDALMRLSKGEKQLLLYRNFNFQHDLSDLFIAEKRRPGGFDGSHLGFDGRNPTNCVAIVIRFDQHNDSDPKKEGIKAYFEEAYPHTCP